MKLTNEMIGVLLNLESCIGGTCYNPHSYDGYHDVTGASFKFPATFRIGEGKDARLEKSKYSLRDYIDVDNFESLHYRMGANHLYVGKGILKLLRELEERYGLDFNELEAEYQKSREGQ